MTAWTVYRLWLTPLAPIHIGTGLEYEPSHYVIEGDTLHVFDLGTIAQVLSPKDREELGRLVDRRPDDMLPRAVQQFFYTRRDQLLPHATQRVPVQPGVVALYRSRVGEKAQHEGRERRVITRLEIGRTVSCPVTQRPILPGSSLKGAIRTALLDQVNAGAPPLPHEQTGLHQFQGRLFRYIRPDGRSLDLCRDPMRLIQVADASWQSAPDMPATMITFAVNKPKDHIAEQPGTERQTGHNPNLPHLLECLMPFHYRGFVAQLTLQRLGPVASSPGVPEEAFQFALPQIAEACTRFYRPLLEHELALLRARGWLDPDWATAIETLLQSEALATGGAFLLRVGRHCGAESVTLNGVRRIKIRSGPGQASETRAETTTMWLAAQEPSQTTKFVPFGWLLVEHGPLSKPPAELVAFKQVCHHRLGQARQWATKLAAQEAAWRRKGLMRAAGPVLRAGGIFTRSAWVDDKLAELTSKPGVTLEQALRGTALAEAVKALADEQMRQAALADIVARWKAKGWWDHPTGGATKKAKAIYEELLGQRSPRAHTGTESEEQDPT
jgi:CRISPR-associated protein Csm5